MNYAEKNGIAVLDMGYNNERVCLMKKFVRDAGNYSFQTI